MGKRDFVDHVDSVDPVGEFVNNNHPPQGQWTSSHMLCPEVKAGVRRIYLLPDASDQCCFTIYTQSGPVSAHQMFLSLWQRSVTTQCRSDDWRCQSCRNIFWGSHFVKARSSALMYSVVHMQSNWNYSTAHIFIINNASVYAPHNYYNDRLVWPLGWSQVLF